MLQKNFGALSQYDIVDISLHILIPKNETI